MIALDALGPKGEYRSRNREPITDSEGVAVAELTIAPKLYVAHALAVQRRTRPLSAPQRQAALIRAADAFLNSTVGGWDFETFVRLASQGVRAADRCGATRSARGGRWSETAFDAVGPACPSGATADWHDSAAWWRRRVGPPRKCRFAVLASGNAPVCTRRGRKRWRLGYRVAVRRSRREPFTGHRLVHALRQGGVRDQDVLFLPTDYAGGPTSLVGGADLAMVYGGQDVVDRNADDPTVFVNGAGRTKILITDDRDWRDYLDVIVDSIANLGGMACVNATAVLCEHGAPALAQAIAERLSSITPSPITDDRAVLPTQPLAKAQALADYVAAKATGTTAVLGADQIVADLGGGRAASRPAVHLLAGPDPDILHTEMGFPCVWVSPWSREDGIDRLPHSLVVNAITGDEALIDDLVAEPSIANVYSGRYRPTTPRPGSRTTDSSPISYALQGFRARLAQRNEAFELAGRLVSLQSVHDADFDFWVGQPVPAQRGGQGRRQRITVGGPDGENLGATGGLMHLVLGNAGIGAKNVAEHAGRGIVAVP